jgi:hypothetical protein
MGKPNIIKVLEVNRPEAYGVEKIRWEDLYVKCGKLSEARDLLVFLKLDNKPYVLVVMSGKLDDSVRGKMRLFVIFRPVKG